VEHLIVLLVELGRWIDKRFQKNLRRALPDLDRLLQDPRGALAGQTITIAPARRYGSAIFLGLLVALVLCGLVVLVLHLAVGLPNLQLGRHPELVVLLGALGVALLLGSYWVVLNVLGGAEAVLNERGVELRSRGTAVWCPWALFNAAGQPFVLAANEQLLLPVSPAAIPFVELRQHDDVTARGDRVKTRRLKFKSGTEAVLTPLYEVNLLELGALLLQLGRVLGTSLPDGSALELPAVVATGPHLPAQLGRNGWIMARLTRLEFPPFCCDCGAATNAGQEFHGHALAFHFFGMKVERGEFASFWIPVCEPCQAENQRVYWRAVWKGLGFGLGVPLLICVGLALLAGEAAVLFAFIPLGLIGGLIGLLIGRSAGKRASAPVQLERYSPSKGTVAIRFRWGEYGTRLLAYLEAQEDLRAGPSPLRPRAYHS
jgi:hypothetical protein